MSDPNVWHQNFLSLKMTIIKKIKETSCTLKELTKWEPGQNGSGKDFLRRKMERMLCMSFSSQFHRSLPSFDLLFQVIHTCNSPLSLKPFFFSLQSNEFAWKEFSLKNLSRTKHKIKSLQIVLYIPCFLFLFLDCILLLFLLWQKRRRSASDFTVFLFRKWNEEPESRKVLSSVVSHHLLFFSVFVQETNFASSGFIPYSVCFWMCLNVSECVSHSVSHSRVWWKCESVFGSIWEPITVAIISRLILFWVIVGRNSRGFPSSSRT